MAESELGRIECDAPGYEGVWVRFKTRGYPFKLRQEWRAADDVGALAILRRYIEDWSVTNMTGAPVLLSDDTALFDDVEETLIVWLIQSFARFWRETLPSARKNSSAPSTEA